MRIPSKYAIALTAALGLIMAILDNTVVNVALVPMSRSLNASLSAIQWVVTGYFLAQAAVIPVAGYFSNRFGIKRLFITCLALFTFGSLLCGLARSEEMLIVFRVFQGLGGGALFPLSQALAFGAFPREERARASAVVSIPVLLAPAFGPTVGGLLTDSLGWEYIFLINIPIGVLAVLLAWRVLPPDNLPGTHRRAGFDYVGLALVTLGVLSVVYAFTLVSEPRPGSQTPLNPQGDLYGWGYWLVWVLLAIGAAILAAFAIYELRVSKDPVLDLRLFTQYDFTISSLVIWCNAIVVFGSLFLLPVFLQQVRFPPLRSVEAGLALMPQGLSAAVAVALGGRLYHRLGVRTLAFAGALLLIVSSFMLSRLTPTSDGLWLLPWLIVRGFGFGLTFNPVQTKALEAIGGPALPKASSLFNVTRQIAASVGIAALVTMFVQQSARHIAALQATIGDAPTREQIAAAATAGMNDVFFVVTIGTCVLLLLTLALPGRPRRAESSVGEGEVSSHAVVSIE